MSGFPWRMLCLTVAVLLLGAAPVSAATVTLAPREQPTYGDDLHFRGLEEVLAESVAYLRGQPANTRITWAGPSVTAGQLLAAARRMQRLVRAAPGPEALNTAIRRQFVAVREASDVIFPIERLDGDVLVGLADEEFLERRAFEQRLGGGMPLFVSVGGEFGE